ncbi:P-loop containing nucleoside triphosphate hydrolase protein [Gyrodon lividus]|nr:P-loop containing nucleoside triphosphate hydrolase protein [Gyrodon lividus]
MNSDDYFDDDIDSGILNQLDIIEAAHRPQPKQPQPPAKPVQPKQLEADDSFVDLTLDIDEAELQRLDSFIDAAYKGKAGFVTGSTNLGCSSSKNSVQTTLFGEPAASTRKAGPVSRGPMQRTKSNPRNPFGHQAPKTKQWDHTGFAKSGWKKPKAKGQDNDGEGQEEGEVEFEQFPAPFISGPPQPMKLKTDMLEAKHWIYPLNQPKRDYQFNIVRRCLFENTLVALPTGLGKTFIAGVVMLNFYRWFPEGKVVFVAPSKPLVAQQIDACHRTCGIPGGDAVELTGNNPRAYRSRMWEEKRVFYMTPQTLMNDLTTENCDARDIILMVIDEAHKGTGDYAYAQIVRFLMAKNPHFRVLALTATPGSTPEAIQAIVDSLHISRIEIRDERSLDLREYMHKKEVKQHIIKMTEGIVHFQQLLKIVMESVLKPLVARGVIEPLDVVKMHPYRATATIQRIAAQRNSPHKWAVGALSKLGAMARAMSYLMEASVTMCLGSLQDLIADKDKLEDGKKKAPAKNQLKSDPTFQKLLADLEARRTQPGGMGMHPKMETLKALLVQHFGERMAEGSERGEASGGDTRAMVFVTYRECVDEIVEVLNQESPLLKATRFVGQGVDKQGKKGIAQREQLEVIKKFKAGEFNVLVSTSIGEEGLDIGEVDMIVCYDAQKTPIRMLQRVGRTGRKRDGHVHVLLAEIREELNWDKAQDTYGELQKCIVRGDQLELYGDVPRLLPDHLRPEVLEKRMEIEEYVREEPGRKKASVAAQDGGSSEKERKRKRNDDIGRNIPPGASHGFVSVADLLVKTKKKKTKTREFDAALADDDSTDMELEGNLLVTRRAASASNTTESSSKNKNLLRKSRTTDPAKMDKKSIIKSTIGKKGKEKASELFATNRLSRKGDDGDDDMEIDQDISHSLHDEAPIQCPSPRKNRDSSSRYRSSSPDHSLANDNWREDGTASSFVKWPHERPITSKFKSANLDDLLVSKNPTTPSVWSSSSKLTSNEVIELTPSPSPSRSVSPQQSLTAADSASSSKRKGKERAQTYRDSMLPVPVPPASAGDNQDIAWLLDDDEDPYIQILSSSPVIPKAKRHPPQSRSVQDDSILGAYPYHSIVKVVDMTPVSPLQPTVWRASDMPPSVFPHRTAQFSPGLSEDNDIPEASFAVRPAGRRRIITTEASEIPDIQSPPLHRLKRKDTEMIIRASTPPLQPKKYKPTLSIRYNPWLEGEAIHSGDEESEGSSHSENDVESESDRQFLKDIADTQVSPSYDQALAYRHSLLSQAPGGPTFASKPARRGGFISAREHSRRRPMVSSSPPRENSEPDEYAIGSFVVDDDADISFD